MTEKTFTPEELSQYDGKDERPAYFACQGVVYDASNSRLWRAGTHVRVHHAGKDLTADLEKAPHGLDSVQRLPVVGRLAGAVEDPEATAPEDPLAALGLTVPGQAPKPQPDDGPPAYAEFLYKLHSHPASVHFPIALCVVASFLHFVAMVLDCPTAGTVADWNLFLGLLSSPLPLFSGWVDWKYQFGGRPTSLFVAKIVLSILFVVVGAAVVAMHFVTSGEPAIIYHVLYLSFAPMVLALGFIGGRLTFPS